MLKDKARSTFLISFAMILSLLFIVGCSGNLYESFDSHGCNAVASEYLEAILDGDSVKMVDLLPGEFVSQSIQEGLYASKSEIIKDMQETLDQVNTNYSEVCGSNWKYRYNITESYQLSEDEVEMYKEYQSVQYGRALSNASEIATVHFIYTIYGNGNEIPDEATLLLFKIGLKWYVADMQ